MVEKGRGRNMSREGEDYQRGVKVDGKEGSGGRILENGGV